MGITEASADGAALVRALELAARGPMTTNPQVGCVVLDAAGAPVGEGWHEGAGTPHAEVAALAGAGRRARGGTAVVTLEPCRHTGRTGPCTTALLDAGVARVVVGVADPTDTAGGGADVLRAAGVEVIVVEGPLHARAADLLRPWALAHRHGRPHVTWKFAATLDGRSAAPDGTSRWVTGSAARADVHARRAACDAVLVGTGTALTDDPHLTVRDDAGELAGHQPLRAVMGLRPLPPTARVLDDAAPTTLLRTRDPAAALAELWARGVRRLWLEGGPRLAAAFVRAGLVDDVLAYLAPALLGSGAAALGGLGAATMADARRLELLDVARVGGDVRVRAGVAVPVAPGLRARSLPPTPAPITPAPITPAPLTTASSLEVS